MEQPESRRKVARWLDLLDGGRIAILSWVLVAAGCIFLVLMAIAMVAEQERPGRSLPVLAQLLVGALIVLRGAADLLHKRHKTLTTSLRLLG